MRDGWRKMFLKMPRPLQFFLILYLHFTCLASLLLGGSVLADVRADSTFLCSVLSGPDRDTWHWWHWHSSGSVLLSIIRQGHPGWPAVTSCSGWHEDNVRITEESSHLCAASCLRTRKEVFVQLGPMIFRGFVKWRLLQLTLFPFSAHCTVPVS